MNAKLKRSNVAVSGEKKLMLERLAINASYKAGRSILWSDIVHYMIDHYSKDAAQDLTHSTNDQKN